MCCVKRSSLAEVRSAKSWQSRVSCLVCQKHFWWKTPCFKWLQHVSFEEPCHGTPQKTRSPGLEQALNHVLHIAHHVVQGAVPGVDPEAHSVGLELDHGPNLQTRAVAKQQGVVVVPDGDHQLGGFYDPKLHNGEAAPYCFRAENVVAVYPSAKGLTCCESNGKSTNSTKGEVQRSNRTAIQMDTCTWLSVSTPPCTTVHGTQLQPLRRASALLSPAQTCRALR